MNSFCISFFYELERDFVQLKSSEEDIIEECKKVIFFLEKKLIKLHNWVKIYSFESEKNEIYFFKELKPTLISKILFYKKVLKIESTLPVCKKKKSKHYSKEINKATDKAREEIEFYEYYRSGATYNDCNYFIRRTYNDIIRDNPMQLFFDSRISTSHEYQAAIVMSLDMLINYLESKIEEINNEGDVVSLKEPLNYTWSGSKIDLVEVIYAIKHAGIINNGNIDVKELAGQLGEVFNVDIENSIYRTYQDIKLRKSTRTKFLTRLTEIFNQKLIEEDL